MANETKPSPSYIDQFQGLPYYDDPAFRNIIQIIENRSQQYKNYEENRLPTYQQMTGYADEFRSQFKNVIGRDPSKEEFGEFFKHLTNDQPWTQIINPNQLSQEVTGLLQNRFSSLAADEAEKRARSKAEAAVAPGSAFDVWQNAYRNSLSETEKSLSDYQTRLFEKLRPNLLTSLQAQGLLNTGALNEAFAGAAKDLSDESSRYIAQAKGGIEADIANRRYDIMASPGNFGLQTTYSGIPNLYSGGQAALDRAYQGYLTNMNFENQMELMRASRPDRVSPLSQYGGLILGGIASGFGQGLGRRAGGGA